MLEKVKNSLNSQLYAISLYARQIAGTVVLLLITRLLTVQDYGLFRSYGTIAGFCFTFANLGYGDYILVSSKANVKQVKLKVSLFMLNAIGILMLTLLGSLLFKLDSRFIFFLVAIRTFFDGTFFALILPYFQASKRFNTIAIINIIYALGIILIAILSFLFKLSLTKFLILSIILGFINFIQCSYYINISYKTVLLRIKDFIKLLDKTLWHYIAVQVACILYLQIQPLFVATYLTKRDAAIYFSAFTIASIINLFIASLQQKLLPELINLKVQEVKQKIQRNIRLIYCAIMLIFLFFVLFGKFILVLFYGKEYYANGYLILLILTLSNLFTSTIWIYGSYITSSGNQKKKICFQSEAIIVAIITLFGLSRFGIYGAAVSYLITTIYLALRYWVYTNNLIKTNMQKENVDDNNKTT